MAGGHHFLPPVNGQYGDASKQKAAEIDNVRSLGFHLPSLVQSSYDRNGEEKGAQVASVPIRALPGNSEAWEVQSPGGRGRRSSEERGGSAP